jgi:serine/threonine protein kinase
MTELVAGDQIGNYRIERAINRAGLCLAYEAVHLVLPRRAVIRVMDAEVAEPEAAQILREAYILEALQHPGVIRVYESGLLGDRRPWSAREHVAGPTLDTMLGRGALDTADAIALVRDLAGVLEHAHQRGVLHCELRPSRVLLAGRSRGYPLCLADWSAARPHDAPPQPCTVTAGSWPYTAPELAAGEPIDERTDVFALGVIAYQMLTGALPYENRRVAAAPDGATFHVPAAFRCPAAPRELTALIDRMLAHARDERPTSAEAYDGLASGADLLAQVTPAAPRIRRPRWTPPLTFDDRPAPPDPRVPVEPMMFGDGLD